MQGEKTVYPALIDADQVHTQNRMGDGITVAVIDTGHWTNPYLDKDIANNRRVLAQYDAILDQVDFDVLGGGLHGEPVTSKST